MNIPITKPFIGKEEELAAVRVLRSGWLTQGARVLEFEKAAADYLSVKYAVATTSCTTSLHLALNALGLKNGDEVIVPSYTFIATANSVLYCAATPVFADVDERTYNLDPASIEKKITKKTKCIIPVHQVGLPCDMDSILKIARKHNLFVVEDAACALGAEYKGRKLGSLASNAACFSFHPRKAVTTGEGGLIVTNDRNLAKKAQMLRNHGASISAFDRHKASRMSLESYPFLGYNYRMTDIQAAIGIEQLKKLEKIINRRRKLALNYDQAFKQDSRILTPYVPHYAKHVYQSYMINISRHGRRFRNSIIQALQNRGIASRPGIMAIHKQPYYIKRFGRINLPVTEKLLDSTIILPLYTQMSKREQGYIIDSVIEIMGP
jgi:dTDP-4-amino-4,6-dideoxygalactose transaminase